MTRHHQKKMKIIFNTTKCKTEKVTDAMNNAAINCFESLKKFLKEDEPIKLSIETNKKNVFFVKGQIVLKDNYHIRGEIQGNDFYDILNSLKSVLREQINKHKRKYDHRDKIVKHKKEDFTNNVEDYEPKIKKIKHFTLDAISEGMAINEMEKLGHEYYLFRNIDKDDKICEIYKRIDGDYSLIIIEN